MWNKPSRFGNVTWCSLSLYFFAIYCNTFVCDTVATSVVSRCCFINVLCWIQSHLLVFCCWYAMYMFRDGTGYFFWILRLIQLLKKISYFKSWLLFFSLFTLTHFLALWTSLVGRPRTDPVQSRHHSLPLSSQHGASVSVWNVHDHCYLNMSSGSSVSHHQQLGYSTSQTSDV